MPIFTNLTQMSLNCNTNPHPSGGFGGVNDCSHQTNSCDTEPDPMHLANELLSKILKNQPNGQTSNQKVPACRRRVYKPHLKIKRRKEEKKRMKQLKKNLQTPSLPPQKVDKKPQTRVTQVKKKAKESQQQPKQKPQKNRPTTSEETTPSYKIGIVPVEFPEKRLSTNDIEKFQRDVLKLIYEQRNKELKPRFTQGASLKNGWMIFHCSDEETGKWLMEQSLWSTKACVAVNEENFPASNVLIGYFKQSEKEETEFILGIVDAENHGLDASSWKILNRKNDGHIASLSFMVSDTILEKLEKIDFTVHYAFGQQVKLKVKSRS